jgi:hypothetical protein
MDAVAVLYATVSLGKSMHACMYSYKIHIRSENSDID